MAFSEWEQAKARAGKQSAQTHLDQIAAPGGTGGEADLTVHDVELGPHHERCVRGAGQ